MRMVEKGVKFDPDSLSEMLPLYYKRLFPFGPMYRWLSYGNTDMKYFANREFSFTLHEDIYIRYQSFINQSEMEEAIKRRAPHKIDIGAIFAVSPKLHRQLNKGLVAVARELVFDIDLTDYDDVRYCCKETDICSKCWKFMSLACKIIDSALREDFGFTHILWVFSGRRGIHCWVCDDSARELRGVARSAIAEYLQLVSGGAHTAKKVHLPNSDKLHPSVRRATNIIRPQFVDVCVKGQGLLERPEALRKLLLLIPDDKLRIRIQNRMRNCSNDEEKWQVLVHELTNRNEYCTFKRLFGEDLELVFRGIQGFGNQN